jgi:hypothetical protein
VFWLRSYRRFVGGYLSEVLSTAQHLQFSHPQNSHDDITGALALAVAHSMQTPPPGVGAAMLSHSEKAKPLYSTRFLQL